MSTVQTSQQAEGRFSIGFARDDAFPWRVMVFGQRRDEPWKLLEVFEWSNEQGAHVVGADSAADYAETCEAVHYYVGEVAL